METSLMNHVRVLVPGIEKWEACSCGRIFSKPLNRYLNGRVLKSGYLQVGMQDLKSKKVKLFRAHRLICMAFHGSPIGNCNTVNHKDNNRLNNSPDNLEWNTIQENINHAVLQNRRMKKLSVQNILDIRKEYVAWDRTKSASVLGKKFGVHRSIITSIINRKTSKHI